MSMGDGLLQIIKDERQLQKEICAKSPVACPQCGEPFEYHETKGLLHCKVCGYTVAGKR